MRTVAVTGASGYLGRKIVELLAEDPDISRVVGVDTVEPSFATRNLEFYRLDVRDRELGDVLAGCDAVVHLAAVNVKDGAETHDVNVTGTRAVVDAMGRAGVRSLVFASSHSVYGYHADNDYPLTESSPVRPSPTNAYASSKAEAERLVDYYAESHPESSVATMRIAWVGGPTLPANPVIESPVRIVVRGYEPESQAVHEDDAARAVAFALRNGLKGTFNVCAADTVTRQDEIYGQRRISVELSAARRLFDRLHRFGLTPPVSDIGMQLYPQVMSNARLQEAGFTFERSTLDAMRDAAAARKAWVAIGKARFRPRRAVLIGGTLGLVLLGSASKRRRPQPESG